MSSGSVNRRYQQGYRRIDMDELKADEKEAVQKLKEILNWIMEEYQCGRKEALKIAEQWIAESVARRKNV